MSVVPGLLFISEEGGTGKVDNLVGRTFSSISSGDADVIAVCNDGVHGVSHSGVHHITPSSLVYVASGNNFFIATDSSKNLYSWGVNCFNGQVTIDHIHVKLSYQDINFDIDIRFTLLSSSTIQLGQGACHQSLTEPTKIEHGAKFTAVASGDAFALALDDMGSAYSWGEVSVGSKENFECFSDCYWSSTYCSSTSECDLFLADILTYQHLDSQNFDRQLGLYTKSKAEMHLQNAMIEDLSFVPRLVPLSISSPVIKIACGLKFAMVITKVGKVREKKFYIC